MKSKQALKEELHRLIDSIEDENTLVILTQEVFPYVTENKAVPETKEDEFLTEEEQENLEKAIRQAKEKS